MHHWRLLHKENKLTWLASSETEPSNSVNSGAQVNKLTERQNKCVNEENSVMRKAYRYKKYFLDMFLKNKK